jgi:hypothetical protein
MEVSKKMDKDLKKCGLWFTFVVCCYSGWIILITLLTRNMGLGLASTIFLVITGMVSLLLYWMMLDFMGYRAKLIGGENRKIRKQKKQILKLEAQKNYLENKKDRKEKILTLNCKIQNLKLELKGKPQICENCGAKVYRKACFCSQCGEVVQ